MACGGGRVKDKERRESISMGRTSGSLSYKAPCATEGDGGPVPLNEICRQVQYTGLLPLETLLGRAKSSRLQKGVPLSSIIFFPRVYGQIRGSMWILNSISLESKEKPIWLSHRRAKGPCLDCPGLV